MKVGDLVKLKSGQSFYPRDEEVYFRSGVIIMIDEYDRSGLWYQVQWGQDCVWHTENDLELVSESG